MMTIEEAVRSLPETAGDVVLAAKPPFTWGSEAMYIELTDDYRLPQPAKDDGYEYLLGASDIRELMAFLAMKKVSTRTAAEFVIHYAVYDAQPAWIDDIPDA